MAAGFDLAGITSADPLAGDARRMADWTASGHAGGMEYLRKNASQRGDPQSLLEGARSVIVAGAAYGLLSRAQGPVASYALFYDYHRVFHEALMRCVEAVEEIDPSARCRVCVDSSPLLERAFAARAGIGSIGLSGMLVTPGFGPCVLLGFVLTTHAFEPDAPLSKAACSECGRCIEACPAGAVIAPRVLDARRCISYLTIEKKGRFTADEAASIRGWAFGCDCCVAVCMEETGVNPHQSGRGLLKPVPGLEHADLDDLLRLCESGFKRSFKNTALFRTGKSRMIRNILSAVENRKRQRKKENDG